MESIKNVSKPPQQSLPIDGDHLGPSVQSEMRESQSQEFPEF